MQIRVDIYRESCGYHDVDHEIIDSEDLLSIIKTRYEDRGWKFIIEDVVATDVKL